MSKYVSEFETAAKKLDLNTLKSEFKRLDHELGNRTPPRMEKYEYEKATDVDKMLQRQAYGMELARRAVR